jgi:formate hydrogenlyase subunit 3/multisubunit Na+/H+ antiporter MnhD subunit
VPATAAHLKGEGPLSRKLPSIAWGLLLLPFGVRLRRAGKLLGRTIFVLLVTASALGVLSTLSGCGTNNNGFFGQQQESYPLTVKATSGPLIHSTTLTLNVE